MNLPLRLVVGGLTSGGGLEAKWWTYWGITSARGGAEPLQSRSSWMKHRPVSRICQERCPVKIQHPTGPDRTGADRCEWNRSEQLTRLVFIFPDRWVQWNPPVDNSEQFLPAPGLKWRCSSHLTLLLCLPACSHPTLHRHLFVFEWPSWAHNTHNEECWSELLTHCCHQHSVESVEKYFITAGQLFQLHSWGQRVTVKTVRINSSAWFFFLGLESMI